MVQLSNSMRHEAVCINKRLAAIGRRVRDNLITRIDALANTHEVGSHTHLSASIRITVWSSRSAGTHDSHPRPLTARLVVRACVEVRHAARAPVRSHHELQLKDDRARLVPLTRARIR